MFAIADDIFDDVKPEQECPPRDSHTIVNEGNSNSTSDGGLWTSDFPRSDFEGTVDTYLTTTSNRKLFSSSAAIIEKEVACEISSLTGKFC